MTVNQHKKIEPLKIVLIAIGGDGGGVLTSWIIKMCENKGYWAQSTSIAGVAQRTGSTVYYIEAIPLKDITINGVLQTPVLAQMPGPFDVDIVMTTELLEAGRALQRKFVSKKTTLIFSTHRNLAIAEKEKPGDGISESNAVFELTNKYAKECLYGNLKLIADKNKSVISASMFGALAASGATPFSKEDFLETITKGGIAVQQSTANFEESYTHIKEMKDKPKELKPTLSPTAFSTMPTAGESQKLQSLIDEIKSNFPPILHDVVYAGITHLSDWQNETWAKVYLDKLQPFLIIDKKKSPQKYELTKQIARYLAIAMAYDDLIFVSDQKTRTERYKEMYDQVEASEDDLVHTLDYLHPSFPEITGFLPKKMGERWENDPKKKALFTKYLDKDRRMYSTNLFSFLMLYTLGGMKKWRLKTYRHHLEMKNVNQWLQNITSVVDQNYNLAVEIAKTYRLKKGYGDTYDRGDSKFAFINKFAIDHKDNFRIDEYVAHLIAVGLKEHEVAKVQEKILEMQPLVMTNNPKASV
ncbi:MAG: indolepyruvate oxidoreductase subunit B [Flavobacteriaceae bacterium]|nr:MAG: indolepyruvate oxidoreductase subunit B [Flavobacteriaceae bacterium]